MHHRLHPTAVPPPRPTTKNKTQLRMLWKLSMLIVLLWCTLTGCGDWRPLHHSPASARIFASATCPNNAPVRCQGWCCPSGTMCAPKGTDGRLCRRTGGVIVTTVCPDEAPQSCGGVCCPSQAICNPNATFEERCAVDEPSDGNGSGGGTTIPGSSTDPGQDECPSTHPIECGDNCCSQGSICDRSSNTCRAPSQDAGQTGSPLDECDDDSDCYSNQVCVESDKGHNICVQSCNEDDDCASGCCIEGGCGLC